MIAQAAGGAYRYAGLMHGGVLELAMVSEWFQKNGDKKNPKAKATPIDKSAMWNSLPVAEMLRKVGAPNTDFDEWVKHAPGDSWWDQFGYVNEKHRFNVPSLHICSWYDNVVSESFENCFDFSAKMPKPPCARDNQFIIVSPTTHCRSERATEHTVVGKLDFGDAQFDYFSIYLKWFDHFLKGEENGVLRMPKVQIYVLGKNQWRGENEWPLARTKFTKYYLRSDSGANSISAKGLLSTEEPGNEAADRFTYDPGKPVPTIGGTMCCTPHPQDPDGPVDQGEVEKRPDVLVYSTPILKQGVEITGPIQARLYVSSDAKDTDFTAKLVDVHPDGTAFTVQEGILRMRYREGFKQAVLMKPGEVYPITVDLTVTSLYVGAGHRIRLEISSSNFPRFERNLNTGGKNFDETEWKVARNVVYHSGARASYVLLPIVP